MCTESKATTDHLAREIATLRESMLRVHYFEESHWLAAAVAFPGLCASPEGQAVLRRAATIAWAVRSSGSCELAQFRGARQSDTCPEAGRGAAHVRLPP